MQYLKFPVGGRVPVAIGCDLDDPDVGGEAALSAAQRAALASDLSSFPDSVPDSHVRPRRGSE